MGAHSIEIDAYIAKAQPFARPILTKIRKLFHRACPEIEESIKWRCPHFGYKGMVGGMAGFKAHATWGLWRAATLKDPHGLLVSKSGSPMGAGKLTDVSQLPEDGLIIDLIKQAVALNEQPRKEIGRKAKPARPLPKMPPILAAALKKNPKAAAHFKAFSPSCKREYIEWIAQAKQDATRQRRLTQAIELIAQGKPQNWKYMAKK